MTLSVGFRITVSLLILLPKLRGSDSYPGGTVSHRTRQPLLDAQCLLCGNAIASRNDGSWPAAFADQGQRADRQCVAGPSCARTQRAEVHSEVY